MARCKSDFSQTVSEDAEVLIMESSDSEAEIIDVTDNSNEGINEEKDYNSDSSANTDSEKLQVNVGPVLSLQCLHNDDDEEEDDNTDNNPDDPPVKIVAVNGSSGVSGSKVFHPQSSIPARNDWEGGHNFKVKIQYNDMPKKSDSTIYSELHRKLYVCKDHPFKVLIFAENVPSGSRIKVTAVFSLIEHSYEVVQRCPTHAQADFSKGNPAHEHFVQSFSDAAVYTKNPDNGQLSVSVPYEKPQEGENSTTYLFKLTCFSSCCGGINRRPFMLIFSLEKDNVTLGRQTIEAKVCACPLRDFKVDQDREQKNREHRKKPKTASTNKSSSDAETVNTKYTISVKDPELYLFLKQMKCLYEMSAYSSKIKPDT